MEHNEPSKAMARSLRVPILEKLASHDKEAAAKALAALAAGTATAGLLDTAVNKDKGAIGVAMGNPDADKWSLADAGLNFIAGATAPYIGSAAGKAGLVGGAALKTVLTPAVRNQSRGNEILDELKDRIPTDIKLPSSEPAENWVQSVPKSVWLGAGGLGIGALGLLAYNAKRNRELKNEELAQRGEGRIHVTLPTKKPGDVETNIELPVGDLNMSKALRWRIGRDTRRRLNEETSGRTRHRPKKKKKEQEKEASIYSSILSLVDEISMRKYAAAAPAPNTGVPTPPQLGVNPAMRMQQQAATAKSIDASTAANPQIQKAEAAAAQAQQEAAMQASTQQQQAEAARMQQEQAFSQQLAKSEQEKEVLKLQLEKEKAIAELNTAKSKSEADAAAAASKGEGDAVQRMANSRIGRLQKRVGKGLPKSANTTTNSWMPNIGHQQGTTPGLVGGPVLQGPVQEPEDNMVHVRPGAGNRLNNHPGGMTQVYQPGQWRHSYGGLGDSIMEGFVAKHLYDPDRSKSMPMSQTDMVLSPDVMGTIGQLYSANASQMPQFGGGGLMGQMKNLYSQGLI